MLTCSQLIDLREKLVSGRIGLELAKAEYWNDNKEGRRS